jgi:hypothetical protein
MAPGPEQLTPEQMADLAGRHPKACAAFFRLLSMGEAQGMKAELHLDLAPKKPDRLRVLFEASVVEDTPAGRRACEPGETPSI